MKEYDFEKSAAEFDRKLKGFGGRIWCVLVYLTGCQPVISQLLEFLRETWSTKMAYEVVGVPSLHKDCFGIQAKSDQAC